MKKLISIMLDKLEEHIDKQLLESENYIAIYSDGNLSFVKRG